MYSLRVGICSLFSVLCISPALADTKQPDDHAPLGVMGDHLHAPGSWMLGYRYKVTQSAGMKNGSRSVNPAYVLGRYSEMPLDMEMGMHMFEFMAGITDNLTLMVMPQYMQMSMTHHTNHGGGHTHEHSIEGPGDTEVTALYAIDKTLHLNLGLSLPTGSINETFADHHDTIYTLPYNMQLGSGTFDPILGATYVADNTHWSWGAQTLNYVRLGKNSQGYRQGNKYTATAWAARNITEFASLSLRLEGEAWGNVSGQDGTLPRTALAGADPNEQAGERVLAHLGINLLAGETLKGHRLAAEIGVPVYERYSGPQPKTRYRLTLGWQAAF